MDESSRVNSRSVCRVHLLSEKPRHYYKTQKVMNGGEVKRTVQTDAEVFQNITDAKINHLFNAEGDMVRKLHWS